MGMTLQQLQQEGAQPMTQSAPMPQTDPSIPSQIGGIAGGVRDFIGNKVIGAPVTLAARTGQAIGALGLKGINAVTGGMLNKYTPEGNLDDAMNRSMNTPAVVPGLGTNIKPVNQESPESIAGEGLSTVGLGIPGGGVGSGVVAGATLGAGNAMQDNQSAGNVALQSGIGGVAGGVLSKLTGPILNKILPAPSIEDTLTGSMSAVEENAGPMANALREQGITDIANPANLAKAQNLAETIVESLQSKASDPAVQPLLDQWQNISNALTRTARIPVAGGTSGVLSKLKWPSIIGGAGLADYLARYEGDNPKSVANRALQAGGF